MKAGLFFVLLSTAWSAGARGETSRLLARHQGKTTSYFTGKNIAVVRRGRRLSNIDHLSELVAKEVASETLQGILREHLDYAGDETIIVTQYNVRKSSRSHHFKFKQHLLGRPIEGASIAMHVDENGTVYALNGEFHSSRSIGTHEPALRCEEAMNLARIEQFGPRADDWEWMSDCADAAVQARDGNARVAYKRLLGRRHNNGFASLDLLFASPSDGSLLAIHPKLSRARSLATYDCRNRTTSCSVVSTSPDKIVASDIVAQDAHNNVVDAYEFFATNFGWRSFDNQEGAIEVFVHYGLNYTDSYFFSTGNKNWLVFGDGDGKFR
jgi:Zn-dependent metalloprotease